MISSTAEQGNTPLLENCPGNLDVAAQNVAVPALNFETHVYLTFKVFLLGAVTPPLQFMILKYCQNEFKQGNPYLVAGFVANILFSLLCLSVSFPGLFVSSPPRLARLIEDNSFLSRFHKTFYEIYAPIAPLPRESCLPGLPLSAHPQFVGFLFSIFIATFYSVQYASEHISLSLDKKDINQGIVVAEITPATIFLLTSLALHLMHGASKIKNNCHARFFPATADLSVAQPWLTSEGYVSP